MSKEVMLHKALNDLLLRVRSAERISFRIKDSLDDVDQYKLHALKYYVDSIVESFNSLSFNLGMISVCFIPENGDEDSNHE